MVVIFGILLPQSVHLIWKSHLLDIGWSGSVHVARAETWTLFTFEPTSDPTRHVGAERLHGFPIRGRVELDDDGTRRRLSRSLNRGFAENGHWWTGTMTALCFRPRHGIRAVVDGRTVDVLICFECLKAYVYDDAKEGPPQIVYLSETPRPTFNAIFRDLGLSVAPDGC